MIRDLIAALRQHRTRRQKANRYARRWAGVSCRRLARTDPDAAASYRQLAAATTPDETAACRAQEVARLRRYLNRGVTAAHQYANHRTEAP